VIKDLSAGNAHHAPLSVAFCAAEAAPYHRDLLSQISVGRKFSCAFPFSGASGSLRDGRRFLLNTGHVIFVENQANIASVLRNQLVGDDR